MQTGGIIMKIALVGAGGMAMSHVQAYQLLGVKDICAVVDPVLENAERAAKPFGEMCIRDSLHSCRAYLSAPKYRGFAYPGA